MRTGNREMTPSLPYCGGAGFQKSSQGSVVRRESYKSVSWCLNGHQQNNYQGYFDVPCILGY